MASLKYKVIASKAQYKEYTDQLEALVFADPKTRETKDEIELLTVLIEKWDAEHISTRDLDPVQLLKSLMSDNKIKAKDLVDILGISKGLVSEILSYKKGFSKDVIRNLASYFQVNQEAFNRPYDLRSIRSLNIKGRKAPSTRRKLVV